MHLNRFLSGSLIVGALALIIGGCAEPVQDIDRP